MEELEKQYTRKCTIVSGQILGKPVEPGSGELLLPTIQVEVSHIDRLELFCRQLGVVLDLRETELEFAPRPKGNLRAEPYYRFEGLAVLVVESAFRIFQRHVGLIDLGLSEGECTARTLSLNVSIKPRSRGHFLGARVTIAEVPPRRRNSACRRDAFRLDDGPGSVVDLYPLPDRERPPLDASAAVFESVVWPLLEGLAVCTPAEIVLKPAETASSDEECRSEVDAGVIAFARTMRSYLYPNHATR